MAVSKAPRPETLAFSRRLFCRVASDTALTLHDHYRKLRRTVTSGTLIRLAVFPDSTDPSRGHFYLAQIGHSHVAATEDDVGLTAGGTVEYTRTGLARLEGKDEAYQRIIDIFDAAAKSLASAIQRG